MNKNDSDHKEMTVNIDDTDNTPAIVRDARARFETLPDDQREESWNSPFADEWLDFLYSPACDNASSGDAMVHLGTKYGEDPAWLRYHEAYHLVRRHEGPEGRVLHDLITETELVFAELSRDSDQENRQS